MRICTDSAESVLLVHSLHSWRSWFLTISLFAATLVTTTAFGGAVVQSYNAGRAIDFDSLFSGYTLLYHLDPSFWRGLYFSGPLLLILLAHELGHYITCVRSGVKASLPCFLPSPLLLGTFGAFIRIRSPIYSRKQLFDIGVSGPIAGFVALVPVLLAGIALSKPGPVNSAADSAFVLGTPLALRAGAIVTLGRVPAGLVLHPFAFAAWAGLLATALNLLPMGQSDGGHILYALCGERWHRTLSTSFMVLLAGLGFVYYGWWIWAAAMFVLGRRHPLVYDRSPLKGGRIALGLAAFIILVLSWAVVPVAVR